MKTSSTGPLRRVPFVISGLLLALYVVNMVARIARIKFHADVFSVGDVGEFLLVLLCMVFFVAGLLALEASPPPADLVNKPQGGVQ